MKYCGQWGFIPITLATLLMMPMWPALANRPKKLQAPLDRTERVPVTSTTRTARCNASNTQPEAVTIEVSGGLASLDFDVSGNSGQPTLRVVNRNSGDETCVTADNLSGSQVELSGAWEDGVYGVYVGDYNGESHRFTLSIR